MTLTQTLLLTGVVFTIVVMFWRMLDFTLGMIDRALSELREEELLLFQPPAEDGGKPVEGKVTSGISQ